VHFLSNKLQFPDTTQADEDGCLAIGGDLSTDRLLLAYKSGIFPWFNPGEPIIWYAPKDRMVLFPKELHVSKSMRKILAKKTFKVTFNRNFKEVISRCKNVYREGQGGTWITDVYRRNM